MILKTVNIAMFKNIHITDDHFLDLDSEDAAIKRRLLSESGAFSLCESNCHICSVSANLAEETYIPRIPEEPVLKRAAIYSEAPVVDLSRKRPKIRLQDHRGPAFSKDVLLRPKARLHQIVLNIEE
jgi:hypothetical protein